ncbi:hypothetical protein LTR99_009694 [Exophiala xenobiotica]|uniref:Mediator of RNA polymerase II transcription subunit 1 n=1 Tax=Vermiconidia calcicola TaxID=1690605 RepID=A0AAV9PWI6_9PEZI|nr:hypothetical protein LTR92_007727 [Exophiala xenobiotica]KAK5530238.1 hypothetical protein LTR23_010458 [Chaetothyriales sp. CCFEE 6169]KAK5530532.1 hypothetical protein LTR25_009110 [Vermiconidia calcicola]KAK5220460.1 hypothetical protein LTR72_007082 [Exophiala xenobiotica]KAK5267852.1 hypothetical protein LTR96_007180 [Exophiala xenobiotica]
MATPTISQAVSTPKTYLTPNKVMASPRPGTSSNAGRQLSYKSPAVKTPASNQGHGHHVSGSSQPSSTPLGAVTLHDDLLALNSPAAAIMASMGSTGMTPLPGGADGLGITTNGQGSSLRPAGGPPNPAAERLHRIQLVADTLKSRVAGRGVTREGVERIAQLQGLNTLWTDEDSLTIAGQQIVDLEVIFDAVDRDRVKDVIFKLSGLASGELQEKGTQIFKENLKPMTVVDGNSRWTDLESYESNLQYLSQLDRIEGDTPCFNVVNDLYDAFQKIWNAEKERFNPSSARKHLRRSAVGKAYMDRKPRLGMSVDYWTRRPDAPQSSEEDDKADNKDVYTARISCEQGAPFVIQMQDWVSDDVLTRSAQASDDAEVGKLEPDWREHFHHAGDLSQAGKENTNDASTEKPAEGVSSLLAMHFISTLSPEIYLPLNVAAALTELAMFEIDQELAVTYQKALQDHFNTTKARGAQSTSEERWPRCLPITTQGDPLRYRRHSYALHSAQHASALWCYPVTCLKFTHPKQLSAAIPILRQYALVWSLLRSLVDYGDAELDGDLTAPYNPKSTNTPGRPARSSKRSNTKIMNTRLNDLLSYKTTSASNDVLPVDVSLDTVSDSTKAKLDIYVPLDGRLAKGRQSPFIFVSINICQDGKIEVNNLSGVQCGDEKDAALRNKIVQIISVTEDIGILVEWLLERARGPV